jgi:hypothetical protein
LPLDGQGAGCQPGDAARICAQVASAHVAIPDDVAVRLRSPAAALADEQLRLATAITARALAYVG